MLEHDHKLSEAARALCRQFDLDLPAYLEGENKPTVLAHARECSYCSLVLADLEQIRFVSRHLPLEEPPVRVWANIRATLADEGILHEQVPAWHRWFNRLPLVSESVPVGALAGLAILALTLLNSPKGLESPGTLDALSGNQQVVTAGMMSADFDSNITRTLKEMEEAYVGRESSMEPTVKETYRRSLDCLDANIAECLKHCRRDPHDALARQYLSRAYQSKAEVLTSALEFDRP
jgi:hypothetical protein